MTRLVKQEPLDRIRIATVVDGQSAGNSRLSHIKQHNIRKNGLALANSSVINCLELHRILNWPDIRPFFLPNIQLNS